MKAKLTAKCARRGAQAPSRIAAGSTAVARPLTAVLCLAWSAAHGQDALHLSLSNESAAAQRRAGMENIPYTVRWGDLKLLTSASLDGEWNDNITLANSNPEADFIFRPVVNEQLYWPVTEVNLLTFNVGVGYQKFVQYSQYDQWLVTPNSALGWDLYLNHWQVNFHDQFSYSEDPTAYGAVSGSATFGGFQNTAGVLANWDLHDVVLSFGYDHFNFIAASSTYDYLTRASDFFTFRSTLQVHPAVSTGIELSGGPTAYDKQGAGSLPDNTSYSAGLFAQWQITDQMKFTPRGGYYIYDFAGSVPEETGYYFSLKLTHQPRESVTYTLEVGNQAYMGNNSSLTTEYYGQVWASWRVIRRLSLSTLFRYNIASQPVSSLYNPNYDFAQADVKLSCPIREKLMVSLEYRFYLKNSDLQSLDYQQNRITFQLAYNF